MIKLGSVMASLIKESKMTKSDICRGLCSVQSLTRFENDIRFPDKILIDRIFQRLGRESQKYEMITEDDDFVIRQFWDNIDKAMKQKNYQYIFDNLEKYEITNKSENIQKQLILKTRADIELEKLNYNVAYELYLQALELTQFDIFNIDKMKAMDFVEMDMALKIVEILEKNKDHYINSNIRISICEYIEEYLKRQNVNLYYIGNIYCRLSEQLARFALENKNIQMALEYVDRAITVARLGEDMEEVPKMLFYKCMLLEKGELAPKEKISEIYQQLYAYYEFVEDTVNFEKVRKILKEKYLWEYTD